MATAIGLKYGRMLAEVAAESGRETHALNDLQTFGQVLAGNAELREALENPVIPFASKRAIVERLAPRLKISGIVANFVLVVLENGRIRRFPEFVEAYQQVLDERAGVVRGKVHAARELPQALRSRLEKTMSDHLGKRVTLSFHSDPDLIGGLKLEVGSMIFDGSIRTRLEVIEKKLASQ